MENYRKQQVTLPSLSFKEREIVYIKILTALGRSDRVDQQDDGRKPAITCRVLNLLDQKEYILICPTLMASAFADGHIDPVGKCFEVTAPRHMRPGKDYKDVDVYQIDCSLDYSDMPEMLPDGSEATDSAA